MQRKCAFYLTVIIVGCNLNSMSGLVPENGIVNRIINQEMGCITAEAAETVEESFDSVNNEESEEKNLTGDEEKNQIEESEDTIKEDDSSENKQEEIPKEELENDCIYNVLFPTNPRAYFDPDNLSGKGQVFSDEFNVENHGNTDIAIKIKNIEVYCRSREEVYELSEESITDEQSNVKKINVNVVWKNKQEDEERILNVAEWDSNEYFLYLKASQYDGEGNYIGLNEGSTGLFYFTGTLNSNPELVWEDGEVTISFDYEIVNVREEMQEQQEERNNQEIQEEQNEQGLEEKQKDQNNQESQKMQREKLENTEEQEEQSIPEILEDTENNEEEKNSIEGSDNIEALDRI